MKQYIVKTKSQRRLIVSAKNAEGAKRQVENGTENRCPWSGKSIDPIVGESVEKVADLGTLFI